MSNARYQQAPYSDSHSPDPHYGANKPYDDYDNGGNGYRSNEYPMSNRNPYAATSSEPRYEKSPKKSRKGLWIILGLILAVVIIVGAVLGGVLGSRASKKNSDNTSSHDNSGSGGDKGSNTGAHGTNFPTGTKGAAEGNTALPSLLSFFGTNRAVETQTGANGQIYLPIATDTYGNPGYATGTFTAGLAAPTHDAAPGTNGAWPADDTQVSKSSIRAHPRIIAPKYKWDALKNGLIAGDPYLSFWNATIVANATSYLGGETVRYAEDGGLTGSGILDVSREIKLRIKNLGYAWQITGNHAFVDQAWAELNNAATGSNFGANNNTRWNPEGHFLDTAEMTSAFAIGYDWMFDAWTTEQKTTIRTAIIENGLQWGVTALSSSVGYNWWTGTTPGRGSTLVDGNWNCVCNGGLILGALAVVDEDSSNTAQQILDLAPPSAQANCFKGAYDDGTWAETANYWYFGTTGAAEMVSALTTAYGDDGGLASSNPGWSLTSLYHIYVTGMTSLFNYGDHGPNKFSTTANSLLLWGSTFSRPLYTLFQRDRIDAAEPFSMFWYDPTVEGAWWNGLEIDGNFNDSRGAWASARTSWTDNSGAYWAIKSSELLNHQTHGDLDCGDFVIDALGQRWAGEFGSGQYLSEGYFASEAQNAERWTYYRKRTEGQNTILVNYANQQVSAKPVNRWGSTGTKQGAAPSLNIESGDSAFFVTDMSSAYSSTAKRGLRFVNGRKQILLQDEVAATTGQDVMWRMHTNATVTLNGDTQATLTLGGQTLVANIVQAQPAGLKFSTMSATPLSQDSPAGVVDPDIPPPANDPITVLVIDNTAGGQTNIQVLFTPQWPGESLGTTVNNVALDQWNLGSH
ncbi:hypothetical protein Q8F55_004621 [Vanrija albida]|uniref:Heparinase II/III-like C-terminal domain-containing protein n=1 Tax=Vanrija albida TaxID=181172 RepID=A0ABR3Q792_9TREE